MRFPVLFLNFERHFLILSEYARFKSCNQLSVLVCYIYLIATCTSTDIAFACFGKESISGAAGTQKSIVDEREKASVPCELAAAASARSASVKIAPPCVRAPAFKMFGFYF